MGSKLLAAFGAGALLAAGVVFFAARPRSEPPAVIPETIPSIVPAGEVTSTPEPPSQVAPRKTEPARKRFVALATMPAVSYEPAAFNFELPEIDAQIEEPPAILDKPQLPPPAPRAVTLSAGTLIQIRLAERLATDRNFAGDAFAAVLDRELVVDGWVIAEPGARVLGKIVELNKAGRVKGIASMALILTRITTSDGQKIPINTAGFVRKGDTSHGNDAGKIAFGAAVGAVIGAAAGGGAGAAIGAASGGAAGTATVLATRGKAAALEVETRMSFRLDEPVTVTERR